MIKAEIKVREISSSLMQRTAESQHETADEVLNQRRHRQTDLKTDHCGESAPVLEKGLHNEIDQTYLEAPAWQEFLINK